MRVDQMPAISSCSVENLEINLSDFCTLLGSTALWDEVTRTPKEFRLFKFVVFTDSSVASADRLHGVK